MNANTDRRKLDALRATIETLWSMNIPEDRLKLTYRVDRGKLMAFGLSMKMVADLGIVANSFKYMNPAELQKEVEKFLKAKKLKFTTYELNMRRFLQMQKLRPQYADIFADCNSELFPHHRRGITVEMYAMKHKMDERTACAMLDEAERWLLMSSE